MSDSNVIEVREWFERKPPKHFASTRETMELLKAFVRIQSPLLRSALITAAQEAALVMNPSEPPKNTA